MNIYSSLIDNQTNVYKQTTNIINNNVKISKYNVEYHNKEGHEIMMKGLPEWS